jgi:hypothetical protein
MTDTSDTEGSVVDPALLAAAVRDAWSRVPVPPTEDVQSLSWICGEDVLGAFAGIAPVDVDVSSSEFLGCTPLLELPAPTAAAYLGAYMLSLLEGLAFQRSHVVFYDLLTRAHLIHCLGEPSFWETVIRPNLPPECVKVLQRFCAYVAVNGDVLAVPRDRATRIVALAES